MTRPSLAGQAAMMPSFGVRAIQPADLEPGKPVHARCRPGGLARLLRTIG
ncbi:MAG TPA: hypothetical protein VGF32_31045 [Streptosporangiaceae bacterium]